MVSRIWLSPILLVLATVLLACDSNGNSSNETLNGSPDADKKVLLALFDLSGSTRDSAARKSYCENFDKVTRAADHGDVLLAGWIMSRSRAPHRLPLEMELSPFEPPSVSNEMIQRRYRLVRDSVRRDTVKVARDSICAQLTDPERRTAQTDIMGSLQLAAQAFDRFGSAREVLVIMSDMVEDSERYNFEKMRWNPDTGETVLVTEREAGRLPDLTGVRVYVTAASAPGISMDRADRIRNFWTSYFEAAGAELVDYGGPLLGFSE